jgi:Protein of unknown function (DUF2867)/Polyketide cyclase / dehydrase and lipid transport
MRRRPSLHASSRTSPLPVPAEAAWRAVASGQHGSRWYVDAAPFVVRGGLDRLVGGGGRRWSPPGRPVLAAGDRVGFWQVSEADPRARRLVFEADVRAPGRVVLTTRVSAAGASSCQLHQTIAFHPAGLLGAAYLVVDLPAREVVLELAHRAALAEVRSA